MCFFVYSHDFTFISDISATTDKLFDKVAVISLVSSKATESKATEKNRVPKNIKKHQATDFI